MPRVLHHGSCKGEFEPFYSGTDYYAFRHKPCREKADYYGHAQIIHVLVDNDGRVIFNLKCRTCGVVDVLKTHPYLWDHLRPECLPFTRIYHFSPQLKTCVKRHWWDNL